MGSELKELNDLLKGQQHASNQVAAAAAAGAGASGLNQLSDAAAEIEVKPPAVQGAQPAVPAAPIVTATAARSPPSLNLPSQGFSQEQLIDAPQPMQFQQPSQPDIPPPAIPESQGASQQVQITAEDAKAYMGANGMEMNPYLNTLMAAGGMAAGGFNPMSLAMAGDYSALAYGLYAPPEEDAQNLAAARLSKGKKQTRRGPMDEMRQLIRILVKIFPHSINMISNTEEAGGGNRISEDQIKNYLESALGEAPQPAWGVPTSGWNGYLAELFSWATGKVVTGEECKRVARREPGRSWEALEHELHALGVHPNCWPLPLKLPEIREAEKNPKPQPIPKVTTAKRSAATAEGAAAGGTAAPVTATTRRAWSAIERDLNKLDENDVWRFINNALGVAAKKANTGTDQNTIQQAKINAKNKFDEILGAALGAIYPYMPSFAGLNDPNLLALIQNGSFPGFDPNDPQAAALAAAAAATSGIDSTQFAAAAAAAAAAGGAAVAPPAKRMKAEGGEAAEGLPANEATAGELMQPPPLHIQHLQYAIPNIPNNLHNLAASIPALNVSMPSAAPEGANGAPAPAEQPAKQD